MIKSKEREIDRIKVSETDKIQIGLEKVQMLEKETIKKKSEYEQRLKEEELVIQKNIQQFKREFELEHEAITNNIRQDTLEIKREKNNLKAEFERIDDYKSEIKMVKDELRE